MQHDTTRFSADWLAKMSPEQVARAVATFGRESVTGGDYAAHIAREAVIDAWMELRGFEDRAAAITDLIRIDLAARLTTV